MKPLVPLTLVALLAPACGSDAATGSTAEEYVAELGAVCAATDGRLDALPDPPDQISLADFATEVADALADEAEEVRRLDPPDELDDDHRAFIQNTDDQASTWRQVAGIQADDAETLGTLSEQIGQLTLGRDDLATEMGATACTSGV